MRCDHWDRAGNRCTATATVHLCSPSGAPIPGGGDCDKHAQACIQEYAEKLGEVWTCYPIDEHGSRKAVSP